MSSRAPRGLSGMSEHEPKLQLRQAQPYVAIAAHVPTEAVPVAPGVRGEGRVKADALPAGRWATYLHVGAYTPTPT
jgi:hypothetical protein